MATQIQVEIDETTLKKLVLSHLAKVLDVDLQEKDVMIEVKSKQNYKSEWEQASFRARVNKTTPE